MRGTAHYVSEGTCYTMHEKAEVAHGVAPVEGVVVLEVYQYNTPR